MAHGTIINKGENMEDTEYRLVEQKPIIKEPTEITAQKEQNNENTEE